MFYLICSRCGPHYSNDDYMENGVCPMCLLVEITEELGLYEEVDFARNENNGPGLSVRQER
ncbi:hypothetical protein SEA_TOMAS_221 [Streptomyces phage Tomas]|uniref:Uncharacterized protein n=1 Tax=Streptomyces phage Tomas TaxID=2914443 RepID=A0AA49H077_9CAUD|nr:hypothetical protein PP453_gp102 [Streptomyces phage Tomas]UMO76365.1 hypothetical protein SEA_TOMAS_221 [Streptomyces phage Tomas]